MDNYININILLEDLINILNPVVQTLGPKGKTVFIEKISITLTKDGITILNNLQTPNKFLNILLQFIKDNINNMNQLMGDGTTSTVVLLMALLKTYQTIDNKKNIINSLKIFQQYINKFMDYLIVPITIHDKNILKNIAIISTNNDEKLGNIIVEIMEKIHTNGIITIERKAHPIDNITYEIQNGLMIKSNVINPLFMIMDGKFQDKIIMDNCNILISNGPLNIINDNLEEIFNYIIEKKKSLVIIAPDMGGNFLQQIIHLKNAQYNIMAIKTNDVEILEDIAIISSSKIFNLNTKNNYEEYLGIIDQIIIQHNEIQIKFSINDNIRNYIDNLQSKYNFLSSNNFHNSPEKKLLSQKIARLNNNMAIIKIQGLNDAVKDEIKDRITDGIGAVKTALNGGITLGGGMVGILLNKIIQDNIEKDYSKSTDMDIKNLLSQWNKTLLAIFQQINYNSDENPEIILEKIYKNNNWLDQWYKQGIHDKLLWDANNKCVVNGIHHGIINPALIEKHIIKISWELFFNIINSSFVIHGD